MTDEGTFKMLFCEYTNLMDTFHATFINSVLFRWKLNSNAGNTFVCIKNEMHFYSI